MGSSHTYQRSNTSNQPIENEVIPIESNIVKDLNPKKIEPGKYFENIVEYHNMHGK